MSKIEKLDNFGRGITYLDGLITFVPNTLPGEDVDVEIVKKKRSYQEGKCLKINIASNKRIKPLCPLFGICGGCDLEHLSYEDTIDYKKNKIIQLFERNKINYDNFEFIKSKNNYNYRNKVTLKVENGKIGYYQTDTHDLVGIDHCFLVKEPINDLIRSLKFNNDSNGELVIRCNNNDELLVSLSGNLALNKNDIPNNIKIVGIISNNKIIYGEDCFAHKVGDKYFKVSYDSFFQVNDDICLELFKIISDNVKGKNVLDLYCGVGSLGINVSNYNKLYGIEIIPNAIKNAITNAKINNKDNAYYMLGDVSKIVQKIKDKIDYVIVDPPRKGLDGETLNYILDNKIENMIYISCNPDTLIRDLKILSNDYIISKVYACDMFPYTYHCESVVILERIEKSNC